MMKRTLRLGLLACGASAALVSTSAMASWTFDSNGTLAANGTTATANSDTNKYSANVAGDPTVSLTGFYIGNVTTAGASTGSWASSANVSTTGGSDNAQGLANQGAWGQGMYTGSDNGSPYHAIDNNQNTEGVLLSFAGNVSLTGVGLGYVSNGTTSNCVVAGQGCTVADNAAATVTADVAVYRWAGTTGTGNGTATVAGLTSTLSGWELVGVYDMRTDAASVYDKNAVNSAGKTSSWWLITAYNSGLKGQSTATGSFDNGNDYFKLLGVAATKCSSSVSTSGTCGGTNTGGKLPEPATLALTSVALLGMAGIRRRKAKTAA